MYVMPSQILVTINLKLHYFGYLKKEDVKHSNTQIISKNHRNIFCLLGYAKGVGICIVGCWFAMHHISILPHPTGLPAANSGNII